MKKLIFTMAILSSLSTSYSNGASSNNKLADSNYLSDSDNKYIPPLHVRNSLDFPSSENLKESISKLTCSLSQCNSSINNTPDTVDTQDTVTRIKQERDLIKKHLDHLHTQLFNWNNLLFK